MTSSPHAPADCELAVCDRCDSYGDGYSAGKDAAYFAISTWELGAHASDCGCRPCLTFVRTAIRDRLMPTSYMRLKVLSSVSSMGT